MKKNIEHSEEIAESIIDIMQQKKTDENVFKEWYKTNPHASKIVTELTDGEKLKKEVASFHREEKFLLAENLVTKMAKREHRRIIVRITSITAALIFASFMIYYVSEKPLKNQDAVVELLENSENLPQRPLIITQAGAEIDLLGAVNNDITNNKNNLKIRNISDIINGKIVQTDSIVSFNRILVPKCYTTKLTLDDGTIVHLNANSELKFPTKFVGDQRKVELKGEAFFEVAKSDKQFIVTINDAQIKVYGTKFNVKSRNKNILETVLVNGSVGVTANEMKEVLMEPNQLLEIDHETQKYKIETVNCEHYLGWVDGLFFFNNSSMKDVIEELEAWYGIKINYSSSDINNLILNISIDRDNKFEDIIMFMEKITDIKFLREGRNVYSIK